MIKEFFTQNEWLGINFSELPVELYSDKLPSAEFYSLFYRELDKKYIDLSQFPIEWLKIKLNTAHALSQFIPQEGSVLSYGCGLGIIEKYLIENFGVNKIEGIDFAFSPQVGYKNEKFQRIFSEEEISLKKYEVIYLSQVIYSLDDSEAISLLSFLSKSLKHNGKLIISYTSILSFENGSVLSQRFIIKLLGNKLTNICKRMFFGNSKKSGSQGWGYMRDNELTELIAKRAGFAELIFFSSAQQSFLICSKK